VLEVKDYGMYEKAHTKKLNAFLLNDIPEKREKKNSTIILLHESGKSGH
jgi:hypothetical protein